MRLLALAIACALGCIATTPPRYFALPEPLEHNGVRIEVTGIIGSSTRPLGLVGTIENASAETIRSCSVSFEARGFEGKVIGRARGEAGELGPGDGSHFTAMFGKPTPFGVTSVSIGGIDVKR